MISKLATITLLSTIAAASPAAGQRGKPTTPVVKGSDRNFKAWNLHCETRTEPAPRLQVCGLISTVTLKNEQGASGVALKLMFRSVPGAAGRQLSVDVPITAWLPEGIRLVHQGREVMRLPFVACQPNSCEAGAVLTPEQVAALVAASGQMDAVYKVQTQQTVTLTFSMYGFPEGISALEASLSNGG